MKKGAESLGITKSHLVFGSLFPLEFQVKVNRDLLQPLDRKVNPEIQPLVSEQLKSLHSQFASLIDKFQELEEEKCRRFKKLKSHQQEMKELSFVIQRRQRDLENMKE
ncbi:hypothetical protein HGM15179_015436 [Zosterops borbonicus]|uniref:Uncharacterized protein n=1 Tax=Zosterops borbonicus TaxID=364589 RepID=A0A8K1LF44_9PASS|nr:hypothetical protein HGM15179_015436 [Zosterops borbonicus]